MAKIKREETRNIISDFAKEIDDRKESGTKPQTDVIRFRNDVVDGIERKIYRVPLNLLRYRKNNGRIAAEVYSYEKLQGTLMEDEDNCQAVLKQILKDKDK
ncbi:MAG: hypothetical protein ABIG42_07200, partial [bacterium]